MLTKEQLAMRLNGREIGEETTPAYEQEAKDAGLVIVFGASDDLMEFRGAIHDECEAYLGHTAWIDKEGLLPELVSIVTDVEQRKLFKRQDAHPAKIEALWCVGNDYSWTFKTSLPHAVFVILEDDYPYCKGIVISMSDLPQ